MKKPILAIPALLLGMAAGLPAQEYNNDTLPVGTSISVRTNDSIDLHNSSDGRIFTGVIDQDVRDPNGNVAIPRGSNTELIVRNVNRNEMVLDLESISVNGRRYITSTSDDAVSGRGGKDGLGKNSRTGKYVGGGAILGTILGAIAGGGRGAAIGAIAGGAAGAGTQVMTRGRDVRVPSESVITFRLDRPLTVGRGQYERDNGVTRGGRHYHYDR